MSLKEPEALGSGQTEVRNSPVGHAYANFFQPRTVLTPSRMGETSEEKHERARRETFLAYEAFLIHAHNSYPDIQLRVKERHRSHVS